MGVEQAAFGIEKILPEVVGIMGKLVVGAVAGIPVFDMGAIGTNA